MNTILQRIVRFTVCVTSLISVSTETPADAATPDQRLEPAPLRLVSQSWKTPAPGAIGLPTLQAGVVRFATEEAIYEGHTIRVRPSIWAASWVPGTGESFSHFERDRDRLNYDLQAEAKGVVFVGRNRRGEVGVFQYSTNRTERIWVKTSTPIPQASGLFERVQYPMGLGDHITFIGSGAGNLKGVYRASTNRVERIADTTMTAPETTNSFHDFSYARVTEDGTVVFTGYSTSGSGLYVQRQGELRRLIDGAVIEPKSGKAYSGVLLVGLEDQWAYFTSFGGTLSIGRVRLDGSSIETLINDQTPLPGESSNLGSVNYASVDNGRILFEAASEGVDFNLFLWDQGSVRSLVRRGDRLEEGRILSVRSGLQALSGSHFVCLVDVYKEQRESFERGVYVGDLSSTAMTSLVKAKHEPKRPGWFKLGSAPIEVFAREPQK